HVTVHMPRVTSVPMQIVFHIPHDIVKQFEGASIGFVGGEAVKLAETGQLKVPPIRPDGYSVIGIDLGTSRGALDSRLPISLEQRFGSKVLSGATVEVHISKV